MHNSFISLLAKNLLNSHSFFIKILSSKLCCCRRYCCHFAVSFHFLVVVMYKATGWSKSAV